MTEKIKLLLKDKNLTSKVLFGAILVCTVIFMSDLTALATQNDEYGYGYGPSGYAYGYGYWTEETPTLALKYNLCTASCSISESTAMTITATFGSAVSGTPQVKVVEGSTTTLAFTDMSGSTTSWTYAYTTGTVSASTTATVSIQTLSGGGYTPTPSNATFTITDSAAAVGGGGGSAAGITAVVAETTTTTTAETTTTTTTTAPAATTVAVPAEVIPKQAEVKNVTAEKEGVATYIKLTTSLPSGDGWSTVHFVAYGTEASKKMSVNDRKGVVGDFNSIYGRVPTSDKDWSDINAILSSQKPSQRVLKAEQTALKDFVKVYKKLPNFKKSADELALYYIGYNIRSATRNLNSEKAAITTFKNTYGVKPSTSHQWAIVRAIAYSGAKK